MRRLLLPAALLAAAALGALIGVGSPRGIAYAETRPCPPGEHFCDPQQNPGGGCTVFYVHRCGDGFETPVNLSCGEVDCIWEQRSVGFGCRMICYSCHCP